MSSTGEFKLYHYDPSFAAAVTFAVLFVAVSIRHIQLLFRKKTWCFIPFLIGCLCKDPNKSWNFHTLTLSTAISRSYRIYCTSYICQRNPRVDSKTVYYSELTDSAWANILRCLNLYGFRPTRSPSWCGLVFFNQAAMAHESLHFRRCAFILEPKWRYGTPVLMEQSYTAADWVSGLTAV